MKKTLLFRVSILPILLLALIFTCNTASAQLTAACSPSYPSGSSSWYISSVTINSVTYTQNGSTHDKTASVFNLDAGGTYSVSVITNGWCGVGIAADFNNDGDFNDVNEILLLPNYEDGNPHTYNLNITIPPTVLTGSYRLRFWNRTANSGDGSPVNSPCGAYGYGSWVDYTLNVTNNNEGCLPPATVAVDNITPTGAGLSWLSSTTVPAAGYIWKIVNQGDDPAVVAGVASGTTTDTFASATGLTAATGYQLYVQSDCSTDSSLWSLPVNFRTDCNVPLSVAVSDITNTTATFGWMAPSAGAAPVSYEYELRSSGTAGSGAEGLVSSGTTTNIFVTFTGLSPDSTYTAYVRNDCGSSEYSDWDSSAFAMPLYEPVAITGFNEDVIANGSGPGNQAALSTTVVVDAAGTNGYVYISSDFNNGTGTFSDGLPTDRTIISGTKYWKLADYSGSNTLKIQAQNATDTLHFSTPRSAKNISVLDVSAYGCKAVFTILYNDNTSYTTDTFTVANWYNGTPVVVHSRRVNRGNSGETPGNTTAGPNMYESLINIPDADTNRVITGIVVTKTTDTNNFLHIFAISINPTSTACNVPNGLIASNVTSTGADISWAGTSAGYQLSYGIDLTDPGAGTTVDTLTTTGFSLSGLQSASNYNIYVRSICGTDAGDTSFWAGPVTILTPCDGAPVPGAVTSSMASVCPSSSFILTLNGAAAAATGISYHWQSAEDTGGPWTDITGSGTVISVSGQTTATYYRAYVACSGSGLADTTDAVLVDQNAPNQCYCIPTANNYGSDYNISSFSTTNGGANITNNNSGSSANNYGDFTSMTVSALQAVGTVNFSVSTSSAAIKIWVDWNQDGDFDDEGEQVFYSSSGSSSYTGTITVPSDAAIGNTRMRIRTDLYYYNSNPSSCGQNYYGETEDYTFNVLPATGCIIPLSITTGNITNTTATVSWTAPPVGDAPAGYEYEIRGSGAAGSGAEGLASSGSTMDTFVNLTGLSPDSTYTAYVRTDCGSSEYSDWASGSAFTMPLYEPINITSMNYDVIANGAGPANQAVLTSTNAVDDAGTNGTGGYAYISADFSRDNGTTTYASGLPADRIITLGNKMWKLSDYNSNNALKLATQNATDTLKFFTPRSAKNIYILAVSGSGGSKATFRVLYSDNSYADLTDTIYDWYNGPNPIYHTMRVSRGGTSNPESTGSGPYLYENVLTLDDTDTNKVITGIKVTKMNSGGFLNIFAVSINPTATACNMPIALTAQNVTSTGADISWTGSSAGYQLSYGIDLTDPGSGTTIDTITMNSISLSGLLQSASSYNVYVRSICGTNAGDTSFWVGPVNIVTPCDGTPEAGTITSTMASVCPLSSFTLTMDGASPAATGISYHWQSAATENGPWTDITGTNAMLPVTGQTAATYYRGYVACSGSGLADTTVALLVGQNPPNECYCIPGSPQYGDYYPINSVTTTNGIDNINNSNSGVSGNDYGDFTNMVASQVQGGLVNFSVATNSYTDLIIWVDWNQDGDFDDAGEQVYSGGQNSGASTFAGTINVPMSAIPGNTRMRVRSEYYGYSYPTSCGQSYYGETEDYTFNVVELVACSDQPSIGTLTSSEPGVCLNESYTLSLSGQTVGAGIGIHFQSSSSADGPWADVTVDTTHGFLNVSDQTAATSYRAYIVCANSGLSDTSDVVTVDQNLPTECYCTPTYSYGGGSDYITEVILGDLDNNTSSAGNPAPYYQDYTSVQAGGTLPIPDLIQNNPYTLSVTLGSDGNQYSRVWIDFNQDGIFGNDETFTTGSNAGGNGTANISINVPSDAIPGQTRMRIRGADDSQPGANQSCGASNSGYGEAEDYFVNIIALTPCNGMPAPGNTIASNTDFCVQGVSGLTLENNYIASSGITYQWQNSTDGGGSWNDIANADSLAYVTPLLTATTAYRCRLVCTAGPDTAYSNPATIAIHPLPIVTVSPATATFCSSAPVQLTATGADTYSWSPADGLDATTGATVNASPTALTAYIVTGTDQYGCSNTATANVGPVDAIQLTTSVAYEGACSSGNPVTVSVDPVTAVSGNMEYQFTDTDGNILKAWSSDTFYTTTPASDGVYTYWVYGRSTDCANDSTANPGVAVATVGFTAVVTATDATCSGDNDGSIVVDSITGPGLGGAGLTWYSNNFSSATLDPAKAALYSGTTTSASITGGICELTPNQGSMRGALGIFNPNGINPQTLHVSFDLTTSSASGADGISWNYGDDATFSSTNGSPEDGATSKLAIGFDAYTNASNTRGIYLIYNGGWIGTANTPTPSTAGVLQYSSNVSWEGATKTVVIDIDEDGKLTMTLGGTTIFDHVQLPNDYISADKSNWKQLFDSRTGGVSEQHAIDNLNITYDQVVFDYGMSAGGSGDMPTTWQTSKTFSNLTPGDSFDVWVANPAQPSTCNKFLGTYAISAPLMITEVADYTTVPSSCTSNDGILAVTVSTPGNYTLHYSLNGGAEQTISGLASNPDPVGDLVYVDTMHSGIYTNLRLEDENGGCNSNTLAGPFDLQSPATGIATSTSASDDVEQGIADDVLYTNASCEKIAILNSTADLGSVTASVTLGSVQTDVNGAPYIGRYYEITPSQNSGAPATITLYFSDDDIAAFNTAVSGTDYVPVDDDGSNIRIYAFHGGAAAGTTGPGGQFDTAGHDVITPTVVYTNGYWAVTFTSPNGFSGFFGSTPGSPLPLILGNISAVNKGEVNLVRWNTLNEDGGDHFELEHSTDARHFTVMAAIQLKGMPSAYDYTDSKPVQGVNYYRVALVNKNGGKTYTKTVSATVNNTSRFSFNVYPNPVTENLTVTVNGMSDKGGNLAIMDATGRTIRVMNISQANTIIAVGGLAQGMYLLKYQDDTHTETIKVNKQ